MKTFLAQTVDQWRDWLAEHHDSASEVWLIFHKLHTGVASIDYKDALDEGLCFGWVDSLVKRLDDRRYARKFTPRKADSRWSTVNRKRYAELKASGRLKPPALDSPHRASHDRCGATGLAKRNAACQGPGIERPPTNRGYGPRPLRLP